MNKVKEIKAAIGELPDADFLELARAIDEMKAERFDHALEDAALSRKLNTWLKRVDAEIDAKRGEAAR